MTTPTPPTLGTIITNASARRLLYATYGVIALAVAAIQVGFAAAGIANPTWLTVTVAVMAFLGASFAGLAAANTPPTGQIVATLPAASVVPIQTGAGDTLVTPQDPDQPAAGTPPGAAVDDSPRHGA